MLAIILSKKLHLFLYKYGAEWGTAVGTNFILSTPARKNNLPEAFKSQQINYFRAKVLSIEKCILVVFYDDINIRL